MTTIDQSVLVLYLAGVFGFGCWFVRRSGTTSEFMSAAGALPGWAVGLSIFGTYLSSNTFLGNPGKAYGGNWNAFAFTLSLPVAAWIAAKCFVPFYRNSGEISAYHHLEERFGLWARTYAMACYVLTQIARMGTILFGVALGLNALVGVDVLSIIVATGVLVTLYTLLGGIEAVIWTDVVQSIVLMLGALLIFLLLVFGMPEGPTQLVSIAAAEGKTSLGSFQLSFTSSTFWVVFLFGIFINLTNFGIDQSFVQRYHTAQSEAAAVRSVWFGALLYIPISLLFFMIGTSLYAFYDTHPELALELKQQVLAERLASPDEAESVGLQDLQAADYGDKVLPHFIANRLPTGVAGLLIAAIFAAAMSSVDTSLNSSATVFLKDIYQRYWRRKVSEREAMWVLRSATLVIGLIGTSVAIAMIGQKSILDAWWKLQGIFAGGMLGLFLLGIVAYRASGKAALTAVVCGVILIGWMTFFPCDDNNDSWGFCNPLHQNMTIVVGTTAIFVLGALIGGRAKAEAHADST